MHLYVDQTPPMAARTQNSTQNVLYQNTPHVIEDTICISTGVNQTLPMQEMRQLESIKHLLCQLGHKMYHNLY
jgi:hypothetical protein